MTETLIVSILFCALVLVLLFTQLRLSKIIILLVCLRPFVEATHSVTLGNVSGYEINPMSIWGGALIIISMAYWIIEKQNPLEYATSMPLLAFLTSVIIGAVLTAHFGAVIEHLVKYMSWMLLVPVVANFTKEMEAQKIFHLIYMALCLLLLINSLLFITGGYRADYYRVGEFYGYFKNPQVFSYTLLFLSPYALWHVYAKRSKLFPLLVLLACLVFITFTYVRATWLAVLVGIVGFLVYEKNNRKKYLAALSLSLFFMLFIYYFQSILVPAFQIRTLDFQQAILMGEAGHFGSGRVTFWGIQLEGYLRSPFLEMVFGNGFRYISVLTGREYGEQIGGHNDYIEMLLGCGLIGLICFVMFQASLFSKALFVYRNVDPVLGLMGLILIITLVTIGFTNGVIFVQSNVYNAVILGSIVGAAHRYEGKRSAEQTRFQKI
jgi:hypothetical protein